MDPELESECLLKENKTKRNMQADTAAWFILRAALKATSLLSKMTFYSVAATVCWLSIAVYLMFEFKTL